MAKQGVLGDNLYVEGVDLSGDIGSIGTIAGRKGSVENTGINSVAVERQLLLGDGQITMDS